MRLVVRTMMLLLLALCLVDPAGMAQSGRKQKKADPQPPVQGVNQPEARTQPEPVIEPETAKEKEKGPGIMIMTGMPDTMIPLYFADIARQGCISELRDILRTSHDIRESRNQNRADAVKAAKDDDKTYVLWLEVELDRMGTSMMGVELRYTIYEPKTAKVAGIGSGMPSQPTGRMPIPPVGASREQVYLDWAARDVARQVIRRLGWAP